MTTHTQVHTHSLSSQFNSLGFLCVAAAAMLHHTEGITKTGKERERALSLSDSKTKKKKRDKKDFTLKTQTSVISGPWRWR